MKNIFILATALLAFSSLAQAQAQAQAQANTATNKASTTNPQTSQQTAQQQAFAAEYQQAKSYFDQKNFQQSFKAFGKLLVKAPANDLVNFYYAMSAAEIGEHDEAIAGFERVLMLNPRSARTRLELARVYYRMGEKQMARNELDIALSANLPDEVRANAMAFRQALDQKPNRHSNSTTIMLGMEYDSNVFNDIGSGSSFSLDGFGGLELDGKAEKSDFGMTTLVAHTHSYKINQEWSWQNQFVGFFKRNHSYSENNINYYGFKTAPIYQKDEHKFSFPLEIDKIKLEGESFMRNLSAGVEINRLLNDRQMVKAGWKARAMRYDGGYQDRDANAVILHFDYSEVMTQDPVIFNVLAQYENRSQTASSVVDLVSLEELLVKADIAKNFNQHWRGNYAMSLRHTHYKDENPWFANTRSDRIARFELGAAYKIDKNATVTALVSHAKHNSNQGPFTYDKTLIATNLIYQF